ncbi:MAG: hypothetical protein D6737_17315 [Chloroflexi bacterium]|nr:MAG: hypothetical protein D6737_17315 [Chloroflexota bacterium]
MTDQPHIQAPPPPSTKISTEILFAPVVFHLADDVIEDKLVMLSAFTEGDSFRASALGKIVTLTGIFIGLV